MKIVISATQRCFLGSVIVFLSWCLSPAWSAESGVGAWRLSLGASVRRIDDIRFKERVLHHPGLAQSPYLDFSRQGTSWTLLDPDTQAPGGYVPDGAYATAFVLANQAAWRGAEDDAYGSGGSLEVERTVLRWGSLDCSLLISLGVMEVDAAVSSRARPGAERGFHTAHALYRIQAPNPPVDPAFTQVAPSGDWGPIGGALLGPEQTAAGLVNAEVGMVSELDARLIDLAVGLKTMYAVGPLQLSIATGPTITRVELDTSQRQMIRSGGVTAAWRDRDSNHAWRLGWSVRTALDLALGQQAFLGVVLRYDHVPSDVGTQHATIDASGFGIDARIGMRF